MQSQSDILGVPVERPCVTIESTAIGAAFLAGLAVGFWKNKAEIEAIRSVDRNFIPGMPRRSAREKAYRGWKRCRTSRAGDRKRRT